MFDPSGFQRIVLEPTGSTRDLDLKSNFDLDLLRSKSICFDASRREKHDGAIADSLSFLVKNLFVKKPFLPFDLKCPLMTLILTLAFLTRAP